MHKSHHRHAGFSLIELMIVVGIVAILAGVAYPAYVSQIAKGRRAECRSALFQSMQQQERYFTQFNTYTAFTEGSASAKTKAFSGDTAAASSCLITATNCQSPASTNVTQCIELRGRLLVSDSSIGYIYLNSDSEKGCTVSGSRTTTNKTCWP
ncbi:MAG: prepilin-type N-terminal cleavage/methylation domain-containing protein [Ramlibacter sp.]|nr:prepilin-type N-terminal cleavage/methylation domain-containing protein [Ramlibacter sp.]